MQRPTVQHVHLIYRHGMLRGVKVEQVGELETERVAEEPVFAQGKSNCGVLRSTTTPTKSEPGRAVDNSEAGKLVSED